MNFDTVYLLDTVSVSNLQSQHVESEYLKSHCRVPDEILYELRDNPHHSSLKPLVYETNLNILKKGIDFLNNLPIDNCLLDLYNAEGNGDIILISVALYEMELNSYKLIKTNWNIVTEDENLKGQAEQNDIIVISTSDFIALLS